MDKKYHCRICKKELEDSEAYDYRGAISCHEHFDEMVKQRDQERAEVIEIENHKSAPFKGLDMASNSTIGKANRSLLKKQIEIAKKESPITKRYEDGDQKT